MSFEYIQDALEKPKREIIDDEEPYYGETYEIKGRWAKGEALKECKILVDHYGKQYENA